jgi:hypothetical protein
MQVIEDARQLGAQIEPDDVLNLREARLAALGNGDFDDDDYQAELANLPAIIAANRRKAIAEGDVEARNAALAEINKDKFTANPDRFQAQAVVRLNKARELGIATPPPQEVSSLSTNERLEMLKDVKDPAARLSLARKWKLL